MGALDSAECSDLVGLYMLSKLSEEFDIKESGGLYRDDGMVAIKGNKKEVESNKRIIKRYSKTKVSKLMKI